VVIVEKVREYLAADAVDRVVAMIDVLDAGQRAADLRDARAFLFFCHCRNNLRGRESTALHAAAAGGVRNCTDGVGPRPSAN
jgi:hypothetical protein